MLATTLLLYAADQEEAERAITNAVAYWSEVRFTAPPDRYVCLPLFLQALPFNADRAAVADLGRYRTMTTEHAVRLLPVFAEWSGTTPAMTFVSRYGQLMSFDLFDSSTNYNATIAARSGSGKSFLANHIITSYLSLGAQVFVIDVGKSYQNLCELLGGSFIDVADARVGLNPFPLVQRYETHTGQDGGIEDGEGDVLEALVGAMAAETEPLSDFQRQTLSRVMHECWASHGRATTIDRIATALLEQDDQRAKDIGVQLFAFTSQGSYGRYFAGANTMRLDDRLVVLELEHLKQRKHLQRVILLQLIYQIQQAMYLGDRGRRKIVIIDEAWDLLTGGEVGKFIETGYRRFRKYGGGAIVITQSAEDLYHHPVGQGYRRQLGDHLPAGAESRHAGSLGGSQEDPAGHTLGLLKSIHTAPSRYAEIHLSSNRGSGIARLVVSPWLQLLYSTSPGDVSAIAALRRQGVGTVKASVSVRQRHARPGSRLMRPPVAAALVAALADPPSPAGSPIASPWPSWTVPWHCARRGRDRPAPMRPTGKRVAAEITSPASPRSRATAPGWASMAILSSTAPRSTPCPSATSIPAQLDLPAPPAAVGASAPPATGTVRPWAPPRRPS